MSKNEYKLYDVLIALFLAGIVLAVFAQTVRFDFVNFDDEWYVAGNQSIRPGWSDEGLHWAFSRRQFEADGLWIPLTWLSYMIDAELFGTGPGAFHLGNVIYHAANAILLFFLLRNMTGARWRSAAAAALFAVHPLHVESVAWISERKDVLSTLFWLWALWSYVSYARSPQARHYMLTLALTICSLMAKPMAVTMPFVLLILDGWPLRRFGPGGPGWKRLLIEKLPFLVIAIVFGCVTVWAQSLWNSLQPMAAASIPERFANAAIGSLTYLVQTIRPVGLALGSFVRNPEHLVVKGLLAAALLLAVTALFVRAAGKHPYLLAGWLLYLVTLAPVSGLLQTGSQLTADRFTYVPLIGIFISLAWGAGAAAERFRPAGPACAAAAAAWLAVLGVLAFRQTATWRDTATLFGHALSVSDQNYVAHINFAKARIEDNLDAHFSEATNHLAQALQIRPDFLQPHQIWGMALLKKGRPAEAVPHLKQYAEWQSQSAAAQLDLALALARAGRDEEASAHYATAERLGPPSARLYREWGMHFSKAGRWMDAIERLDKSLQIEPDDPLAHHLLAMAALKAGLTPLALSHFDAALQADPAHVETLREYARVLVTHPDPLVRNGRDALRLAGRAAMITENERADVLYVLAAAYAELGRFDEATKAAGRARELSDDPQLDEAIEQALRGFASRKPLRGGN